MTPRVAIACSGLGHVHRGNETWAATVGEGLHKSGGNVIVFGSGPRPDARSPYVRVPCLRRDGWLRKFFSWNKAYLWEQVTFARSLKRHLTADRFDIVHTADPNVAQQLITHTQRHGLALVYQDSLFIGPQWCSKFDNVQALAPYYKEAARRDGIETTDWKVIPQMVDTRVFAPAKNSPLRSEWFHKTIPPDAPVALAVGDFSPQAGKRLDWILSEVSQSRTKPYLVLVGNGFEADLQPLKAMAEEKLPDKVRFVRSASHREMPSIYQAADLFLHAAVCEPFGLAIIEAMACGLPVLGQFFEVTRWIVGDGGEMLDMTKPGQLAAAVDSLCEDAERRAKLSAAAVARARLEFDREVLLPKYHAWYGELTARQQRR